MEIALSSANSITRYNVSNCGTYRRSHGAAEHLLVVLLYISEVAVLLNKL